jgi:hypothetical protein
MAYNEDSKSVDQIIDTGLLKVESAKMAYNEDSKGVDQIIDVRLSDIEIHNMVCDFIVGGCIIDVKTSIVETTTVNILELPQDILIMICSIAPKLGLTCKKLNAICPKKPKGYKYEKNEFQNIPCSVKLKNVDFWFYKYNVNMYNDIIESPDFQSLRVSKTNKNFKKLKEHIEYMIMRKINYDDFKYKSQLDTMLESQKNGGGFTQLPYYDSVTMGMLFYLYH